MDTRVRGGAPLAEDRPASRAAPAAARIPQLLHGGRAGGHRPVPRRVPARPPLAERVDRHGHDDRRRGRHADDDARRRGDRRELAQAKFCGGREPLLDTRIRPSARIPGFLAGQRLANRERHRRRRGRPGGRGDHARHRRPVGFQPADRTQSGVQPCGQHGRRRAFRPRRLEVRHRGRALSCRGLRRPRDRFHPDDPPLGDQRRGRARPRARRRRSRQNQRLQGARRIRSRYWCWRRRWRCSISAMRRCCRSTGWRSSRPSRAIPRSSSA